MTEERPRPWCRPWSASLLLLAVYALLSLLMSPGGYLGTDTGAKVATLDVMDERGTARPVLGYWAEDLDPEGRVHPIFGSEPVDGDWVHVTTLPMLELARPLWSLGGYRLTLLLPMLGGVLTAWAARRLVASSSAPPAVSWAVFWAIGLASPIIVYALDFWEHALGVGCIVMAVALLARVVDEGRFSSRTALAGLLLGTAATMRTEALVYTLVAVVAMTLVLVVRTRALWVAVQNGAAAVGGFAVAWSANLVLEAVVGGNPRGGRATAAASGGLADLEDRAREVIITTLAIRPAAFSEVLVVGGIGAGLLTAALVLEKRDRRRDAMAALALVGVLQVATIVDGLGFVPGMLAACPLVVAAFVHAPTDVGLRYALAVGVASLPLVWAFQLLGGAGPQWAGRYALPSCILLAAVGLVGLCRSSAVMTLGVLILSGVVSASGVLWLSERSHSFERLFDELVVRPEDVIVARNGFFVREGGDAYGERLWLTAVSDDDLDFAVRVIERSDHDTFAILDEDATPEPSVGGAGLVRTTRTSVVGVPLFLHSYAM